MIKNLANPNFETEQEDVCLVQTPHKILLHIAKILSNFDSVVQRDSE